MKEGIQYGQITYTAWCLTNVEFANSVSRVRHEPQDKYYQIMNDQLLPKTILIWHPHEIRKKGRPRETWIAGVKEEIKKHNF